MDDGKREKAREREREGEEKQTETGKQLNRDVKIKGYLEQNKKKTIHLWFK